MSSPREEVVDALDIPAFFSLSIVLSFSCAAELFVTSLFPLDEILTSSDTLSALQDVDQTKTPSKRGPANKKTAISSSDDEATGSEASSGNEESDVDEDEMEEEEDEEVAPVKSSKKSKGGKNDVSAKLNDSLSPKDKAKVDKVCT